MRVRLLGTGSADGWPNAFCDCASCLATHQARQWRGPTSALIDGRLLLDCSPQTPAASLRYDEGLRRISHVLVTRYDPDVSVPVELLARGRAGHVDPLTVIGPEAVIAAWCACSGPDDQIRWRVALPGDELDLDGYQARVLAAAAETQDAVVYDLSSPQGKRLLYASDTGALPEQTIQAATDAAYDLVLLEATFGDRRGPGAPSGREHLDLSTFADQMVRLRGARALTRRSVVAAVHLSHHSPSDLRARLSAWGVLVVDDGHEFDLERPRPRAVNGAGSSAADGGGRAGRQAPAPRRTLVLGGVRSGKSAAAEQLLATEAEVTYVATGYVPAADDVEWAHRVAQHQARRPAHWATLETTDLADALRQADTPLLVDCLGMWLTEVLGDCGAWDDRSGWRAAVQQRVDELVEAWHAVPMRVVAVSNEVGSGVVPPTASGRIFRDQLGRLNARLSAASEQVLLVIAGRTLNLAPAGAPSLPALAPPATPTTAAAPTALGAAASAAPDPTSGTTPAASGTGWPERERRATPRPPRLPQDTA